MTVFRSATVPQTWWTDEIIDQMGHNLGNWQVTQANAPTVFQCPDRDDTVLGYGWNWAYAGTTAIPSGNNQVRLKYGFGRGGFEVDAPQMIGFGCNNEALTAGNVNLSRLSRWEDGSGFVGAGRHGHGGPNIGFLDGHLESRKSYKLLQGQAWESEWFPRIR